MSKFLSDRLSELKAYKPGEQPRDEKFIKLNTNESPYPPSKGVIEAINSTEVEDLRLYSDPTCKDLRSVLAEYLEVKFNNIICGNGSDEILSFIYIAFCDKQTGVCYPEITYGFYPVLSNLYGIEAMEIPLKSDFSINADDYCNVGRTIIIANPNAPTGICLSLDEIEKIIKTNSRNIVVIDEAYVDFGGVSAIELIKKYENLIVVQTFSKSRSLAGGRLGFAVANERIIEDLETVRNSINPYNVNRLTLVAGKASIENQSYYDSNCHRIILIRKSTVDMLKKLGFEITDSKANFIFVRHNKISGSAIYEQLKQRGILVRHFDKPSINDYVRITIGTEEEMAKLVIELKELLT